MSKPLQPQFATPGIIRDRRNDVCFDAGVTVPTDAATGYAPNALYLKIDATGGAGFYVNRGTRTSCNFDATIDLAALTATLTELNLLSGLTATSAELNTLHSQTLTTGAPAGFTGGTGTVYKNSVQLSGGIYYTSILMDLTGLSSSTTDLDVIGQGAAAAAHIGQITAAQNGTILAGQMTCLEVPAGGVVDIDLYWAVEGTAKFDDGIAALTETALITSGGNWTLNLSKAIADPVGIANGYLYLTCGAAGTAAPYTAGKFRLDLFGV